MTITGNEPAMPYIDPVNERATGGLAIRQYFAAMAMQGLCANSVPGPQHKPERLAYEAVEIADAVINQLNKQP